MKFSAILIILILSIKSIAQNIVLNSDFEMIHECEIYSAPRDSNFRLYMSPVPFYAESWFFPKFSTTDYYNLHCVPHINEALRNNHCEIPAKSGKGCAGFNLFAPDGNFEPLTGTLGTTMFKDSIYLVTFKLCYLKKYSLWSCKKIGIKFSENLQVYPRYTNPNYVDLFQDIKVIADKEVDISDLADSTFWKEFSFYYKAKGNEKYITFGMFYQPDYDLNRFCDQFASYSWRKTKLIMKVWLRFNRNNPVLTFKGKVSTFIKLDERQKRLCYYFLDDVTVVPEWENNGMK
ncbi:MAG: hypothetical protein JW973_06955 [Bacteroidales bacterium]|nr:hypothetical protein [Bacteroidales bacterium]